MVELADIFRQYGPAYRAQFGDRLLPSHRQAMWAIEHCRTETLGGHVYHCPDCAQDVYQYHSCRNRHCPKCQNENAQHWLEQQRALLLPVPYFMLTFTLPAPLRPVARSHQRLLYDGLFRTSAAAAQSLAADPRLVGGQLGLVGVLHTWGRTLTYHPHVHYLIPAGGLTPDTQIWQPAREDFLLPVKALSPIFRARFREALRPTDLFESIPASVWQADWVVHCQPVGNGQTAFKYLAPYIFRVAISNSRLLKVENDQVTFRYRATGSGQPKLCTLAVPEFIHRFLQHVLPKSFVKVRYYGFLSSGQRAQLATIRQQLGPAPLDASSSSTASMTPASSVNPDSPSAPPEVVSPILDSLSASATTPQDTSSATGQAAPARSVVRCPICGRDLLRGSILHASRRTGHPP